MTVLPHSFIDFAVLVNKLSESTSLAIDPVADVVATVGVDESAVTVVVVTHELALIDRVVDLLANTSNSAVIVELPNDELVGLTLAKWTVLVDVLLRVGDDVLKSETAKLHPLVSGSRVWLTNVVVDTDSVEVLKESALSVMAIRQLLA